MAKEWPVNGQGLVTRQNPSGGQQLWPRLEMPLYHLTNSDYKDEILKTTTKIDTNLVILTF
jgi:hypothetical protein